jgi:hypothetical protein
MQFLKSPSWRVFLIVLVAGLAWAVATGQEWEDYYITYRASKNLAEGKGLVFTEGQRVHSFTSPLGVLLPAASYLLTGRTSDVGALWIFRIMSLAAWGGAAVLMWRTLRRLCPATPAPAVLFVALLVTDSKTICFVTSGMETAFLLLFLAWTLWALLLRPARFAWHLGLAWGGLMWTRPDSCIYIAALAVGFVMFAPEPGSYVRGRFGLLRPLIGAAAICTVVYLPWFTWAWLYYGTPVPHTIIAKGLFNPVSLGSLVTSAWEFPKSLLNGTSFLKYTFAPYHGGFPPWAGWIVPASFTLSLLALVMLVLPRVRWEARLAALAHAAGQFYLAAVVRYPVPWYVPIVTFLGVLVLVLGFGQWLTLAARWREAATRAPTGRWLGRAAALAAIVVVLGTTSLTIAMGRQAWLEMHLIEDGVRAAIGKWLRAEAKSPQETVFLEPLGFIGFHSGLKMLDYPGLGSPEVVAARRRAPDHSYPSCLAELVLMLRPDWVVLRPFEIAELTRRDPVTLQTLYERVRVFDVTDRIRETRFVTIRSYLEFNGIFEVYRLKPGRRARPEPQIPLLLPIPLDQWSTKESPYPVEFAGNSLKAHAPSRLVVDVPAGANQIIGGFGLFEGAYAKAPPEATDGAGFIIDHVAPDGKRTELLRRFLNPVVTPGDRGLQWFNLDLPAPGGRLEFTVNDGLYHSSAYDWSYWHDLRFGVPQP